MSYQLQILADAPFSFWKLDGSGPTYADSAGSLRQADLVGSAVMHSALVAGSGNALVLNNTNRVEMDDPVFNKGYEGRQWSLEAWIKPVALTDETSVMSHDDTYDGLTIDETHIYFRTKYISAGECEVSYRYRTNKAMHIVGVHTSGKNSLYVDGKLVGETDMTDEQLVDSYDFLTSDLIAGQSVAGSIMAIDAPAIYAFALNADAIARHYRNGINTARSEAIAGFNYATLWRFTDEYRSIAVQQIWQTEVDWTSGVAEDVVISDNALIPFYSQTEDEEVVDGVIIPVYTNTSLPGIWKTSVPVSVPEADLAEAQIRWEGEGDFTVEYSLDGTTWEDPADSIDLDLTNAATIDIRVTFAGGIEDDTSYLDFLQVVVFIDKTFKGTLQNRFASFNGTGYSNDKYYEPIEYSDENGFTIVTGSIDITADDSFEGMEEEPEELYINGFDMWIKPGEDIYTDGTNSITRSGGVITYSGFDSVVVNGEPVASGATVFNSDSWHHIAAIYTAPLNPVIEIGDAGTVIAQMAAIYGGITEEGLQQIYSAYLGLPGVVVEDSSTVDISQPANPATIYSHVWSISAAG